MKETTQNWLRLLRFVRQQLRVTLHRYYATKARAHGCYDRTGILISFNPKTDRENLAAVLIHEFGHHFVRCRGRYREEQLAWRVGRKSVPKDLVPACFARVRRRCLRTYRK